MSNNFVTYQVLEQFVAFLAQCLAQDEKEAATAMHAHVALVVENITKQIETERKSTAKLIAAQNRKLKVVERQLAKAQQPEAEQNVLSISDLADRRRACGDIWLKIA
jgi:hypothetical protein